MSRGPATGTIDNFGKPRQCSKDKFEKKSQFFLDVSQNICAK